jgi:transposase
MTMSTSFLLTRAHDGGVSDDLDPAAKPKRRQFSAEYKLAILAEYERLADPGAKGALLRREGLYSSHIVEWRRARDAGALRELAPKSRPAGRSAEQVELDRARRKIERLEDDLAKHKLALEIQGKHRSSWSGCWPRARRPGGSCDRGVFRRDRADARHPRGVRRGGPPAGDALPPPGTGPAAPGATAARATEQAERWRGQRHLGRAALGALR